MAAIWQQGGAPIEDASGRPIECDDCPCDPPPPPCPNPPCETFDCTDAGLGFCAAEFPADPFVDMGNEWDFGGAVACVGPFSLCEEMFNGHVYELINLTGGCAASKVHQFACPQEAGWLSLSLNYRSATEGTLLVNANAPIPEYAAPHDGWYLTVALSHRSQLTGQHSPQWIAVYKSDNCDVFPLNKKLTLDFFASCKVNSPSGPVGACGGGGELVCQLESPPGELWIVV